jgi:hypothetical protein
MGRVKIEWRDAPTMNPKNTRQLRALIERRTLTHLWGARHFVVPRLVTDIFGDGRLLLGLSPIRFRPNYFVVRIDSGWSISNWDQQNPMPPGEWLDRVYDSIQDEFGEWPWAKAYGLRWTEEEGDENDSRIQFRDGCEWWDMGWPRIRRR